MIGFGETNALQRSVGDGNRGFAMNIFADFFTVTNTASTSTYCLDIGNPIDQPSSYYRVRKELSWRSRPDSNGRPAV
jgi:hypothetical protein